MIFTLKLGHRAYTLRLSWPPVNSTHVLRRSKLLINCKACYILPDARYYTSMAHKVKSPVYWQRKVVACGLLWGVFFITNSTFNEAPRTVEGLSFKHVVLFLATLFPALFFTLAVIILHKRRAFLSTLLIVSLMALRVYKATTFINVLLVLAVIGFIEWYIVQHSEQLRARFIGQPTIKQDTYR